MLSILGLAASDQLPKTKFYSKMRSLHESPAKIQVHSGDGVKTTYLSHFLDLGRTVKYPLQKLLRISFFVVLFVKKLMATKKKKMFLTLITLSLTMDFMRPSNIWMVGDILGCRDGGGANAAAEEAGGTTDHIQPLAFAGWRDVSAHHDNITKYFRDEKDAGMKDWQTFISTKRVAENNFLFFSSNLNDLIRRHPSFKRTLRLFSKGNFTSCVGWTCF